MNKTFFLISFLFSSFLWSSNLEVGADWLYWEAEQSQMFFLVEIQTGDTTSSNPLLFNEQYNNGYRVFANYGLNECWHLNADLTHLSQNLSISKVLDPTDATHFFVPNSFLYPIFQSVLTFGSTPLSYSSVGIDWSLNLYYFDFDISRVFWLCNRINIEPYFGIRGLWMNQKVSVDGFSPNAGAADTFIFDAQLRERNKGIGLQGGCDFICNLRYGFSLVGLFGGSLVYSKQRMGQSMTATADGTPAVSLDALNAVLYRLMPIVDCYIGLQYRSCICHHEVEIHGGWENHFFFHTNQLSLTQNGNLSTQGLTLGGSIGF